MISGTLLLASSLTYSHCSSVTPFNAYTGTQIATSAKQKKQKKEALNFAQSRAIRGFFGGEQGIRTLEHPFRCYTISNRAPSASSDISPFCQLQQLSIIHKSLSVHKDIFQKLANPPVAATPIENAHSTRAFAFSTRLSASNGQASPRQRSSEHRTAKT